MPKESLIYLIWKSIKGLFFLPGWWSQRFIKRDEKIWIFGAWKGILYSDNSRAFFEFVRSTHSNIQSYWITKDHELYRQLREQNIPVVLSESKDGRNIQKKASKAFVSWGVNSDFDGKYLNGCQIVLLWHGMPLKKIGNDEWDFKHHKIGLWKIIKTKFRKIVLPYEFLIPRSIQNGIFDTISTSSFFTPFIMSAWHVSEDHVWEVGQPRNDYLFSSKVEEFIAKLDQQFNHPIKVMYMPTFRDSQGEGFNPFDFAGFNAVSFSRTLQEQNMVFIYKGHFCDQSTLFSDGGRMITVGDKDYDNLYTFVKDIDILITDYSSIYFDFLLCRKPIILFPFDKDDYLTHSRPFYFDYELMEGKKVYSWTELETTLKNSDYWTPSEETILLFNSSIDGSSSERLLNILCHE